MVRKNIIKLIGIVIFLTFSLLICTWYFSFPIEMRSITELTFHQFNVILWPAMIICLLGLFIICYLIKNQIVRGIVSFIIPPLLYVIPLFFFYLSSSDSGNIRGMFEVFQSTGIDPNIIPYFQYPLFFSQGEMIFQILSTSINDLAVIQYIMFGGLCGLFIFLFYSSIEKKKYMKYAFVSSPVYFISMFSFVNYQWVPQTLSLVIFVILLYLIQKFSDSHSIYIKLISIIIFLSMVFSHAFIPVIFLIYIGLLVIKKRDLFSIFITFLSVYLVFLIFFTTNNLDLYLETFFTSIYNIGGDYVSATSKSFESNVDATSRLISTINRVRVPLIWGYSGLFSLILFLRKKIHYNLIALGFSGGIYLLIGSIFSILGMRAFQIIFIPLIFGVIYAFCKYRKLSTVIMLFVIIFSVAGPMRTSYDRTHFLIEEDFYMCDFFSKVSSDNYVPRVATNQVNYGYLKNIYLYKHGMYPQIYRPGTELFENVFNITMRNNEYILYNTNMGKEIVSNQMTKEDFILNYKLININNLRIFTTGKSTVLKGSVI